MGMEACRPTGAVPHAVTTARENTRSTQKHVVDSASTKYRCAPQKQAEKTEEKRMKVRTMLNKQFKQE
jgi:hypothetical protein